MVNKNTDEEDKIKTNKDSSIKLVLKPISFVNSGECICWSNDWPK